MQGVLSGFSVRLLCFNQAKLYVGMVVCMSAALVLMFVDVTFMPYA